MWHPCHGFNVVYSLCRGNRTQGFPNNALYFLYEWLSIICLYFLLLERTVTSCKGSNTQKKHISSLIHWQVCSCKKIGRCVGAMHQEGLCTSNCLESIWMGGNDYKLSLLLNAYSVQACKVWLQSRSDLPQMGQIRDFFQIRFLKPALKKSPGLVPFGANLFLKSDLKKARIVRGQSDTIWSPTWHPWLCIL